MTYRITRGDLEITKNVLTEIIIKLGNDFAGELKHFQYDKDCPSYSVYNNVLETLIYVDKHGQDLTN